MGASVVTEVDMAATEACLRVPRGEVLEEGMLYLLASQVATATTAQIAPS